MALNQIIACVSIIFQIQGGNVIGSASGFFYTKNDELFLVTNKHVVCDKKKKVFPDSLRLRLHKDPNDITKNGDFEVLLYDKSKKPLWKTPPQYPDADVAIIKLDKDEIQKEFFITAFSGNDFLPKNYRLDPGEDVFIMGYPLAFYDNKNNLPIFRNAMIASAYPVYFRNLPCFLTDANLHPGTSGSPVITKPKNTWVDDKGNTSLVTGTKYYLVGVHSGTIDPNSTMGEEIGLGAAWYVELVEDIVSLF